MENDEILRQIEILENNDFTMESFKEFGSIIQRINQMFNSDIIKNKVILDYYLRIKTRIENIVLLRLQSKLPYSDIVIRKIISCLYLGDKLEDIYTIDDTVIIKLLPFEDNKSYFIFEDSFKDVASNSYNEEDYTIIAKKLIVDSINNLLRGYINEDILKLKDTGYIVYKMPDVGVYMNASLSDINSGIKNGFYRKMKLLINYGNDIYSYNAKLRDGYFFIINDDNKINKMSSDLENIVKVR